MNDYLSALAGGMLIGLAASFMLAANGRIAGVSGMLEGLLLPRRGEVAFRLCFVGGLLLSGVAALLFMPERIGVAPRSLGLLALGGLFVGVGTQLGRGCTSGHGVCGVSRASPRSLTATATFVGVAMLTVALLRQLGAAS